LLGYGTESGEGVDGRSARTSISLPLLEIIDKAATWCLHEAEALLRSGGTSFSAADRKPCRQCHLDHLVSARELQRQGLVNARRHEADHLMALKCLGCCGHSMPSQHVAVGERTSPHDAIQTDFSGGRYPGQSGDVARHLAEAIVLGCPRLPDDIGPMIASLMSEGNRGVNS